MKQQQFWRLSTSLGSGALYVKQLVHPVNIMRGSWWSTSAQGGEVSEHSIWNKSPLTVFVMKVESSIILLDH